MSTTTTSCRTITTFLFLLLLSPQSTLAKSLRTKQEYDDGNIKPRKQKVPDNSATAIDKDLEFWAQHPRDLSTGTVPSVQNRVVGGNDVTSYDKHPYFAEWFGQFCGGALVHDDLVLTAAHCDNAGNIARKIYFRTINRREQGAVERRIVEHVTHPKFNAQVSTRDYDYMLLKLDKSALVDDNGNPTGVQTIDINTDPSIPDTGDALWGLGYGQLDEEKGGMSPVLQEATIFAFSNDTCRRQYQQYYQKDYMFCSGVEGGGIDTCQGDSGGPIVHKDSNTLVGIVSFGIGCARSNYAGVNSRVSTAAEWVIQSFCSWSNYKKCNGSYEPTPAPTDADGSEETAVSASGNPGSITVTVKFDDYPEETAWTLLDNTNSGNSMFYVPFESVSVAKLNASDTFDNLVQGVQYTFKIADSQGDGICCGYGNGSVTIYDNVKDDVLWSSSGMFGSYYEITFRIQGNGRARLVGESPHYSPSTWPEYEKSLAPDNEPLYPGNMPVLNSSSIMVNFDTDDYPEESSWKISKRPGNNGNVWVPFESWTGENAGFRELVSVEVSELDKQTWYKFEVRDTQGDGNCCQYGQGYVSLTGPLAAKAGEKGLIWGNDGQFFSGDEVFFYVTAKGYISHISMTEATLLSAAATASEGTTEGNTEGESEASTATSRNGAP